MKSLFQYCHKPRYAQPDDLISLVHKLFDDRAVEMNKKVGSAQDNCKVEKDGGFKCLHFPVDSFMDDMRFLVQYLQLSEKQLQKISFLDVGSGVGQKVYLAHLVGFNAYGLELRKKFVTAAIELFWDLHVKGKNPPEFFIRQNALKFNRYDEFDVIYFYCPIWDEKLQTRLERIIQKQAKPGTIVIPNLSLTFNTDLEGWKPIYEGRIMKKL